LQEEVLARVLSLLQPCQLHWVERVNKRLRNSGAITMSFASSQVYFHPANPARLLPSPKTTWKFGELNCSGAT